LYVVLLLRFGWRSSVVHLCFASTSTVVFRMDLLEVVLLLFS